MQTKICGLREPEHVEAAVEAGADCVGVILYPPARRYLDPVRAREIFRSVPRERVRVVGIFVNETADHINRIAELVGLDVVQLGGDEAADLTARIERPVARTVHVDGDTTFDDVSSRISDAKFIHLDARKDGKYGGTGSSIDWEFARKANSLGTIWLAGGLNPDNVEEAIRIARPALVDVSSGIETNGRKDSAKIRSFVTAAQRAVAGEASITR